MASIHPFRALRPAPESAPAVSSVPYDVVSTEEARQLAAGNPAQFSARHARRRSTCPLTPIRTRPAVYERARQNFDDAARARAARRAMTSPALYFYRLRMGSHEQTGIAGCFSVDEYENDIIKKHERTRRDKEDDRTRHIVELRAQTGVVFLTYRAVSATSTRWQRGHGRRAALRLHRRRRRPPHHLARRAASDVGAGGGVRGDSRALHRGRPPSRRQCRARARGAAEAPVARRRGRGRHVHRGRVSRQPDADPSVQPHREGSGRAQSPEQFLAALRERFRVTDGPPRRPARARCRCISADGGTRSI